MINFFLGGQRGSVLILTFIIMITLLAVTSSFLFMTSTQLRGSGYNVASAKALWLGEAGLEKALYTLKNDPVYRANPFPITGSLGDGTYSVTAIKNGSMYTFTSTGTVDVLKREITLNAAVTSAALNKSIHADGSLVNFGGSSGTVNGDMSCHVQVLNYQNMTINGTITQNVPKLNPSLDFNYYKSLAQAGGTYSTSNLTFANGTYTGVYYTTKNATIGNNAVINGSVITEGSIGFANKANNVIINPANNYPALATQGSISSSDSGPIAGRIGLQNSTINGLILTGINITFDYMKNTVFNGTMLSGSAISLQNGTNILMNYNAGIFAPMPPGFGYTGGAITVIPQKDWNEIVPAI